MPGRQQPPPPEVPEGRPRWLARRQALAARPPGRARLIGVTAVVGLAIALTGCTPPHATAAPITVASAFVLEVSGATIADGYLVIQNSGPADRLTSVRSSAGGAVLIRGPARSGTSAARAISEIAIPAHAVVRLDPTGVHLVLTYLDPKKGPPQLTLTLVFARAGTVRVLAQVTNPQTQGGGYFGV